MEIIDQIRAVAWYKALEKQAGVKSPYELSNRVDDLRTAQQPDINFETKAFAPYANGKRVPSDITLDLVEKVLPNSKSVFTIGPHCESGPAPLWLALGGSKQAVQSMLVWFDKDYGMLQASGAPMEDLVQHFTKRWMSEKYVIENMSEANQDPSMHMVAYAYRERKFLINMPELVALIALWRLSMISNSYYPYMDYFMRGFMQQAIPDLLKPYGIDESFPGYCALFTDNHIKNLKRLEQGNLGDKDRS